MPRKTSYAPGTPNWVDLSTPDPEASSRFYATLFGWEVRALPTDGAEPYHMAYVGGAAAAGMMRQDPAQAQQGMPPAWSMYISVPDVDAATARVQPAGGQVFLAPMDVMGEGRMSFVLDSVGAPVGLWQARNHIGCQIVNEHGAFTWSEVVTDHPERLNAFYEPVSGGRFEPVEYGGAPYTALHVEGRMVAGTMRPRAEGVPPHWHVYFLVDEADGAAAAARAAGGSVVVGPMDTPAGRMATLSDPHGAVFSVIQAS